MAELYFRQLKTKPADFTDDGTIQVAFSSEYPAQQRATKDDAARGIARDGELYWESLSHSAGDYDLSRLNNSGAFLDEHITVRHLGKVLKANVSTDKVGRAVLEPDKITKLSRTRAKQMRSGSRPHVSFGYAHTKYKGPVTLDDGRTVHGFAWSAKEISSVSDPADVTVGANRAAKNSNPHCLGCGDQFTRDLLDEDYFCAGCAEAADSDDAGRSHEIEFIHTRNQNFNMNTENRTEIIDITKLVCHDRPDLETLIKSESARALVSDKSVGDYKRTIQELLQKNPPKANLMFPALDHEIGMDRGDIQKFSFQRMFQSMINNRGQIKDCFEADVSRQVEMHVKGNYDGCLIPSDIFLGGSRRGYAERQLQRDMLAGDFSAGGAAVGIQMLPPIDLLRNKTACLRLGATVLAGLTGDVVIPREVSPTTPQSVSEIGAAVLSQLGLDQIRLTPHRVSTTVQYSQQLVFQSTPDIEAMIQRDTFAQMAIYHDEMLLNGSGNQDQPLGLTNQPGVGSIVFGGTTTFQQLVNFETQVAKMNADEGKLAFLTTPGTRGRWKGVAVALLNATTVSAHALWDSGNWNDGFNDGKVNDYRAAATNQIPLDRVVFGNWMDMIYAQWGGVQAIYDPYSLSPNAEVRFSLHTWLDTNLRHAQSFIYSADAGSQ
ncbi:MAG: phage major capsid protein [Verrucomicrobiota bacterium]|jgi:hypothetical protein